MARVLNGKAREMPLQLPAPPTLEVPTPPSTEAAPSEPEQDYCGEEIVLRTGLDEGPADTLEDSLGDAVGGQQDIGKNPRPYGGGPDQSDAGSNSAYTPPEDPDTDLSEEAATDGSPENSLEDVLLFNRVQSHPPTLESWRRHRTEVLKSRNVRPERLSPCGCVCILVQ
jgi:hypothetical protein